MADNVPITAGVGTDVATDDVSSVHYQKIKIAIGADGAVDGLLDYGQAAAAASLPVVLASDQPALSVGGITVTPTSTLTRAANTTQYASGEVIADASTNPLTIQCARANGGSGVVTRALLVDGACQATAGEFEVWLFDTTLSSYGADNAAFTPTDAECATLVGIIPFSSSQSYVGDATAGAGGNRVYVSDQLTFPFVCGAASDDLYWVLIDRTSAGYSPVSEETFCLILGVAQD